MDHTRISFDEESLMQTQLDSKSDSQFPLKVIRLNEETRQEAIAEYGRIYRETKNIDKDSLNFEQIIAKLRTSVRKENSCLSRYGVNELLTMDAKNMSLTSEYSFEMAKKLEIVKKFDKKEYLKKLKEKLYKTVIQSNLCEINKKKQLQLIHCYPFGRKYRNLYYSTPYLCKSFKTDFIPNPEQQKKVQYQRKKLPTGEVTKPKQFDSTKNTNNVDESDKRLEDIFNSLQKLEKRNTDGVPFLQASINPKNFAVTVENIFNLSFLARQSRLVINFEEETFSGEPLIRTKEPDNNNEDEEHDVDGDVEPIPDADKSTNSNKENLQSVFSFDMNSYKDLIQKCEILQPAFN